MKMKRIMKMKKIKAAILLLLCLAVTLGGCKRNKAEQDLNQEEIAIPGMFLVNPDTGENENEELINAFNEAYKGRYRLEVEWITDTAEGYRTRIKTLNGLDKLPAVITDVGFDADFYNLLIENHRLVDLKPYILEDKDWETAYGDRELEVYEEADGGIYLSPSCNSSVAYAGFYYNKGIFNQMGIETFPKDWDSFFSCLELLKSNGITPLAIHGGSSYWTPLLIATGYAANTEGGLEFLDIQYPKDYKNESAASMFAMLKRLYEYADADALNIERTESARRFLAGEAAITANGGWMFLNISEEEKDMLGFAPFPGNVMMEDMKMSTWAVTAGYTKEVTEGAVEFLKFRARRDEQQEKQYFSQEAERLVEREYKQAAAQAETIIPNYQLKWEAGIQEEFLVNVLPLYIEDEISQEEFLSRLNEAAAEIEAEK